MYQGSKRREDESEPTQKEAEQMGEPADEDVTEKKTRKMNLRRRLHRGGVTPQTLIRDRGYSRGRGGYNRGYASVMRRDAFNARRFDTPANANLYPPDDVVTQSLLAGWPGSS